MQSFNQRKFFTNREYKITETKLYYNVTKFGDGNEVDIPYENIEGDKVSFKSSNSFSLYLSLTLYAVGFMTLLDGYGQEDNPYPYLPLIWAGIGTIMFVIYFLSKKSFWKLKLSNNSYLYVHKRIPNEEKTNRFLSDLISARNEYLRENYATIDENLSYESQLSNFRWLKSIQAISKEEFNEKYTELKRIVKPDKSNIGFGK